jgi:hypothetical protein
MGASTRLNRADLLIALGRPAEALQVLDAESVRAAGDTRTGIEICHANLLLLRPRVAKDACERAVGSNPKFWSTNLWLASARAQLGDIEGARTFAGSGRSDVAWTDDRSATPTVAAP